MESHSSSEDDRLRSFRFWKERCECPSKSEAAGDFLQCRCGVAKIARLVCEVCEAELVVRYNNKTNTPFWACSDFARTGCKFTRTVRFASSTQEARTPSKQGTTKRPKIVTPNSSQPDNTASENRKMACQPVCLFPAHKTLHDTFIGADLAAGLIADGFPGTVYSSSKRNEGVSQQPKLYYEEKQRSGELFCYSYNQQEIEKCSSGPLRRNPVVLELFAGAGGMSTGLERAGFDVQFAVEEDVAAADTLRSNHKEMIVFQQNVVDFLDEAKPKGPCYPKKIEHLHASPPCQGFSLAKQSCQSTTRDIQNNNLIHQFLKAVGLVRPITASMENVGGIMSTAGKKRYLQEVVAELLKMEYQVRMMLLNAEDYGVPQDRKRVFLLAAKKGFLLPKVPSPLPPGARLTVEKALGNLETVKPIEDGVPVMVNDKSDLLYDHRIEEEWVHRGRMDYLQVGKTANTVRRCNGIMHYRYDRLLTIRERARLQSFPDSYHFCGTPVQQSDQIGNAVPVNLAEAVGRSIMECYR